MHKGKLFQRLFFAVIIIIFVVVLFICTSSPLYTTEEIEAQLEKKYGMSFQVKELVSKSKYGKKNKGQQLFYHVIAEDYPNELFLLKETYMPAHWSRDFFFNFPVRNEEEHTLEDNCLTYAWNTFLVPKFEDMGIYGFSISDPDSFDGITLDYHAHTYRMYYHQNAEELVDVIYQISQDLNSVPFFCNLPQSDKTSMGYYELFFDIHIDHQSDIIPLKDEDSTWLPITIGYRYTRAEIKEELDAELEELKERNTPIQEATDDYENLPQHKGNKIFIDEDGNIMISDDKELD